MEKLFLSLAVWVCAISLSMGQQYAVFNLKGAPNQEVNGVQQPVKKGAILTEGNLVLAQADTLMLLDTSGQLFQLDQAKTYAYADVKDYAKQSNKEGLSKKYFSYVWRQMQRKDKTKNHTGNVYRDGVMDLLLVPADSTSIYQNSIHFEWEENPSKEYTYFFLKNTETEALSKLKIKGNSITLYPDNTFLVKGNSYSWGIAYEKFPDFNRIKFNDFDYLTEDQYQESIKEYYSVIEALKAEGFNEAEIHETLCNYFNMCTD